MTARSDRAGAETGWWSCGEEGASHLPGVVCPGFAALWLSMTSALYTTEDQWNKGQVRVFCLSAVCSYHPAMGTSSHHSSISVFFPPKIIFFQWFFFAKLHESVQEREFVTSSKMYLSVNLLHISLSTSRFFKYKNMYFGFICVSLTEMDSTQIIVLALAHHVGAQIQVNPQPTTINWSQITLRIPISCQRWQ